MINEQGWRRQYSLDWVIGIVRAAAGSERISRPAGYYCYYSLRPRHSLCFTNRTPNDFHSAVLLRGKRKKKIKKKIWMNIFNIWSVSASVHARFRWVIRRGDNLRLSALRQTAYAGWMRKMALNPGQSLKVKRKCKVEHDRREWRIPCKKKKLPSIFVRK